MKIKLFIIFFSATILLAQNSSYPPPTSLITAPTAGTLVRGSFSFEMRIQNHGGLATALAAGITDRFQFGVSYGANNFIGDDSLKWYPRPEASLKYRLIDETITMPGIALGINTQGFGRYHTENNLKRYDTKAYGLYAAVSKNWKFLLGNIGIHGGVNYNFTETTDGDKDPNMFMGIDMEVNPELSFLMEYNSAFNENDKNLQSMALNESGYLNAAVRWTFVQHLHIEVDFNNLLFNEKNVDYFNREIKLTYIEYF